MNNLDTQYKILVEDIINNGTWKNNRTGIRTKTVFGKMIRHDMSEGFPLLTTRRLPIKSTWIELEGFIHGITDKEWYQSRGCHFWDFWCRPDYVSKLKGKEKEDAQLIEPDLGPIYGYQWRKFNEHYPSDGDTSDPYSMNGVVYGYDQFWNIVENIRTGNDNRRLICSAWNPNQLSMMALPPCHMFWQVNILDGKLNLYMYQRSMDIACNQSIVTYGTLLHLLAREGNLIPGELIIGVGDTHIYEPHIELLQKQVQRPMYKLPELKFNTYNDILSWTHKDCYLENYQAGEQIKYPVVI